MSCRTFSHACSTSSFSAMCWLYISEANDAAREALIADVRNALGKYTSNSELAFPVAAHLLDARV
jgi:hypothetical protein